MQRIFYRVAVLVWHCLLGIAPSLGLLAGTMSPCIDSAMVGRQAFRSSSGGKLLVPSVNTAFYLEFTSLAESNVTKQLSAFALQVA